MTVRTIVKLSLGLLLVGVPSSALADAPYESPYTFQFYCGQYTESFVEGGHYQFDAPQNCVWINQTVPATRFAVNLFRGVPGNAEYVGATGPIPIPSPAEIFGLPSTGSASSGAIPDPQQDEPFFAAFYEEAGDFPTFFRNGSKPAPSERWGIIRWKWGSILPPAPDPVIIVPGILGSDEHNGVWEMDPILHVYDDLIATLDTNGYTLGETLFTFPYDWRKSNVDTAVLLKQKIDEVKAICHCNKVDLVAHSMGGLVARQYIQSASYEHDVDQLIFLGTPHSGAPKAYLMWEGGEFGPVSDVQSSILEMVLRQQAHEKGYQDLFQYEHGYPVDSIRELLPTYDYIFDNSSLRQYPNNYPTNQFLQNLKQTVAALNNSGVRITNIVGDTGSDSTISGINSTLTNQFLPKWLNGYPSDFYNIFGSHGLEMGSGDGTVPFASAAAIQTDLPIVSDCHISMPSQEQNRVFEILTGHAPSMPGNGKNICNVVVAIFKILSPADIVVVTPNGKRIGKDFATNQEINEVPGAFYSGFNGTDEYVTILNPIDGQYKILTKGTDAGIYTLETDVIKASSTTIATFSGQTAPGLITEHIVNATGNSPTISPVDQIPPQILIAQPATSTYLHSDILPIRVSLTDNIGISTSTVTFDSKYINASSSIDLFFEQLGNHFLQVSSTDYVGNATSSARTLFVIATASSTQNDVNRIFALGWISSKDLRNLLLSQLNLVVKWQTISSTIPIPGNPKKAQTITKVVQVIDTILLKAMLAELQLGKTLKQINAQGYQVLTSDINWLITHN